MTPLLPRYENIVQIRCLYEGITVDEMLDSWHDLLPVTMQQWKLDRHEVGHGDVSVTHHNIIDGLLNSMV